MKRRLEITEMYFYIKMLEIWTGHVSIEPVLIKVHNITWIHNDTVEISVAQ